MTSTRNEIVRHLPLLRRYARCLTGSQDRGDRYVRVCLESIIADVSLITPHPDARIGLFRVFHALWTGILTPLESGPLTRGGAGKLERHIRALPALEREVLLLTTLCEFTLGQAATILGLAEAEARDYLKRAREDLNAQTATRVLVIEDEPVIAFDLASIVTGMGHSVVGIADTRQRAVELARAKTPGIVLADIQLRDGSSGIDAAREIIEAIDVPVIFITAFPERLLTGERKEPTYLITKPFDSEVLRVTIAQALLLHPSAPAAAAG
jgi:CheY-like chemotaxis protein/DNA-directed RNA polymerase specialized sigma24 family protein